MKKEIKDFPGYFITDTGQIWSDYIQDYRRFKLTKDGYYQVCLSKDGKQYYRYVHRLVAEAFIPNPNNLPQVNHKDENPQNNEVSNLEWCNSEYNINYGTRNKRVGKAQGKKVLCIETNTTYYSSYEAERQTKISSGSIRNVCLGRTNIAGGYHWKYV